jgi:hypothetical protein
MKTYLITSLFNEKRADRMSEYLECLRRNLANDLIEKVVVFFEGDPSTVVNSSKKLSIVPIKDRPTYFDFFDYANRNLKNEIIIISNSDMYYDDSLRLLESIDFDNLFIFLTRWFVRSGGKVEFSLNHLEANEYSADTLIFKAPLREFESSFKIGTQGCDSRIAHEAAAVGYRVINPCHSVISYHLHISNVQNDKRWEENKGPYGKVPFSHLIDINGKPIVGVPQT